MSTLRVKIIRCSNKFSWYANIQKIKDDAEDAYLKVFDVEYELTEDGFYRTINDVAGPGVKGFINSKDVE